MLIGQVAAARNVAATIPECHNVMLSGLRTFALVFLLGGLNAAAIGAEPAPGAASLNSDLEQLTLRQAEIFFAARNREIQLGQRLVEGAQADRLSAAARPNPNIFINATQIGSQYPAGYDSGRLDRRADTTIGINQMFERGGKRELRIDAADQNIRASRGDYADIQRQQKVALYAAYYDLVAAQEKLRISTDTAGLFRQDHRRGRAPAQGGRYFARPTSRAYASTRCARRTTRAPRRPSARRRRPRSLT